MNALPEPLRQVARDMVDKKLWPIAVLLIAAIVAVPLLIGGSSGDAGAPPAPVAAVAPGAADAGSLIKVVDQAETGRDRPGDVEDPIYDPPDPEPAAASAGTAAGTSAAAAPSGGPPGGATPGDAPTRPAQPTSSTPTVPAPPAAPASGGVHYRTVMRWYSDDAGKPRPISRLTPFGASADPVALYLGVTRSQATYAVFLLGSHATSEGDGRCEDDDCRVIGLKAGDKQTVTHQPPSGEARRYQLEVVSLKTVRTDGSEAREMRAKVHPEGRKVMREMWQDARTAAALGPVQYHEGRGLLYKVRAPEKAS